MSVHGMELERARFAYAKAEVAAGSDFAKKYKSYSRKIPSLIQVNGLGATLAFITTKNERAYAQIRKDIHEWLQKSSLNMINKEGDLQKQILSKTSEEYRAITNEVITFLFWLSKYAEGLIEGEDGD